MSGRAKERVQELTKRKTELEKEIKMPALLDKNAYCAQVLTSGIRLPNRSRVAPPEFRDVKKKPNYVDAEPVFVS